MCRLASYEGSHRLWFDRRQGLFLGSSVRSSSRVVSSPSPFLAERYQNLEIDDPFTSINTLLRSYLHKNSVLACQWNPNGHLVATGSRDQSVRVFDIRTFKELETFKGHKKDVTCTSSGLFFSLSSHLKRVDVRTNENVELILLLLFSRFSLQLSPGIPSITTSSPPETSEEHSFTGRWTLPTLEPSSRTLTTNRSPPWTGILSVTSSRPDRPISPLDSGRGIVLPMKIRVVVELLDTVVVVEWEEEPIRGFSNGRSRRLRGFRRSSLRRLTRVSISIFLRILLSIRSRFLDHVSSPRALVSSLI